MIKHITTLVLFATQAFGVSFYDWDPTYGHWLPLSVQQEQVVLPDQDAVPFEAPAAIFNPQPYQPLAMPTPSPRDLLANLSFFRAPFNLTNPQIWARVGSSEFLLPSSSLFSQMNFPLQGVVHIDNLGDPLIFWQLYRPMSQQLNQWLLERISSELSADSFSEGLYNIELFLR